MTVRYFLAAQIWILVGLIAPIGMTIYFGTSGYIPGIIFSIVVVNIFLMVISLISLLQGKGEYKSEKKIISSDRAAIISFFSWNFFAAYVSFWEGKLGITALMLWAIGGVIAYLFPLLLLWMYVLIKGKVCRM